MIKKLFQKKAEPEQEILAPLSPAISQTIVNFLGARGVPTMPKAAQKAFQLSINPNAEIRDFIEVIKADEALSARILKIANSVYYDRGRQSETVEQCAYIIGLEELKSLLNATTLSELFPSKHELRKKLWSHAIATAVAAQVLADKILPEKKELAYAAGLMHDIGKLLILQRAPEEYEKVVLQVRETACSYAEAEGDIFVFNHCEVGQLLGSRWNFSTDLLRSFALHHKPWSQMELLGKSTLTLAQIVKIANQLVHANMIGYSEKEYSEKQREALNDSWKACRLPETERTSLIETIAKQYETEAELFSE